jgi:hypothetical protein
MHGALGPWIRIPVASARTVGPARGSNCPTNRSPGPALRLIVPPSGASVPLMGQSVRRAAPVLPRVGAGFSRVDAWK